MGVCLLQPCFPITVGRSSPEVICRPGLAWLPQLLAFGRMNCRLLAVHLTTLNILFITSCSLLTPGLCCPTDHSPLSSAQISPRAGSVTEHVSLAALPQQLPMKQSRHNRADTQVSRSSSARQASWSQRVACSRRTSLAGLPKHHCKRQQQHMRGGGPPVAP